MTATTLGALLRAGRDLARSGTYRDCTIYRIPHGIAVKVEGIALGLFTDRIVLGPWDGRADPLRKVVTTLGQSLGFDLLPPQPAYDPGDMLAATPEVIRSAAVSIPSASPPGASALSNAEDLGSTNAPPELPDDEEAGPGL